MRLNSPGVLDLIDGSPGVLHRKLGIPGVLLLILVNPGVLVRKLTSPGVLLLTALSEDIAAIREQLMLNVYVIDQGALHLDNNIDKHALKHEW